MPKNDHTPTRARQPVSFGDAAAIRQRLQHSLEFLGAHELLASVRNAWPTGDLPMSDRVTLDLAVAVRDRFPALVDVDHNCALFGWRLRGFAPADRQPEDSDDVLLCPDLEWLHPAFDAPIIRSELGEEPVLRVSTDGGETWRRIELSDLGNILGEWREARRGA